MKTEILSSKLVRRVYGTAAFHEHWCPGCEQMHVIAVDQPFSNGARWSFDGNAVAPTFNPSVNVEPDMPEYRCHYFIRAGRIQFLPDSHHKLRGQTVDLPDIPARWLE